MSTSIFGPFEIVARLGVGGMAETFEARRRLGPGFEQRVCLKRILPAWQREPRYVRMFLEEARVAARLRHATIVHVIDAGAHEGTPWLALELVEGADLRRVIDVERQAGRRLAPAQVAQIALDLATALEFAHGAGVLHRDVTPSNVLVSVAGEVKLADFGIAKADDSALRTATGIAKGKAAYLAPEYVATGRATVRSDLYALGVTLFECATGRKPFPGRTALAASLRAARRPAPAVATLAPGLPPPLARAIDRLLEPDPEARFASAAELFDALAQLALPASTRRGLGALARAARAGAGAGAGVADPTEPCALPTEAPTRAQRRQPRPPKA